MKLRRARIKNFKCIKDVEISFETHGAEPRFLTCLVGPNSSGKTSVLQAIALVLSLATGRTRDIRAFDWKGFLPDRIESHGPTKIRLEIEISDDEFVALKDSVSKWATANPKHPLARQPIKDLEHPLLEVGFSNRHLWLAEWLSARLERLGRFFVTDLALAGPERRNLESRIGDVFWFDQYRILGNGLIQAAHLTESVSSNRAFSQRQSSPIDFSWEMGVASLREMLVGLWTYHVSTGDKERDLMEELQPLLARVFQGVRLAGVQPRTGVANPTQRDFLFLLEQDGHVYDISEMSSGEQAVFEIMFEFLRANIARSVVLIDELELHLHPPQQQALLAALRKIGPDCQFIITTHSRYVEDVLPEEEIVRLEGGRVVG